MDNVQCSGVGNPSSNLTGYKLIFRVLSIWNYLIIFFKHDIRIISFSFENKVNFHTNDVNAVYFTCEFRKFTVFFLINGFFRKIYINVSTLKKK